MLEKLMSIQSELKCNKGQYNKFGGYAYRSCEDILEVVKPILAAHKTVLTITDEIVMIGDRFYIKAIAELHDCESDKSIITTAYAREPADKKGSDASQITGAASSYARKYALNGLFCIDDTKDADSNEYGTASNAPSVPAGASVPIMCTICGLEINPAKNGNKTLSPRDIANMTGGRCLACWKKKEAQKRDERKSGTGCSTMSDSKTTECSGYSHEEQALDSMMQESWFG